MSRCYPFQPPVRNEIRVESLIDSIKGRKEEVKKDRKNKRKEREYWRDQSKKHRHKRHRASKKVDVDCELINSEKSCLTVEPELQTSSQNSCDSTHHDHSQSLDGRHNDSDTGIRIQLLHGKEQKDDEVMITNKNQKQSSSRERLAAPRESFSLSVCREKGRDPSFDSSRPSSSSCTHPKQEKPLSSHQEIIGPSKLLCSKCPPSTAVRFLNLIENWAPDRVESKLTDSEDQEWWLLIKYGAKRHDQVSNEKTSQGSSWMAARFLPEAQVHALPFTVPF